MPIILGTTKDEGALAVPQFILKPELIEEVHDNFDVLGPVLIMHMDEHAVKDEDAGTANLFMMHYLVKVIVQSVLKTHFKTFIY